MQSLEWLPHLDVFLDGNPLTGGLASSLQSIRVAQALAVPALCELSFAEPPSGLVSNAAGWIGSGLEIRVAAADSPLFAGEITAAITQYPAAGGLVLVLRAYDLLHRLRKQHPLRMHPAGTVAELARRMLGPLGLRVEASDAGPIHRERSQVGESDFHLLVRSAREAGLYPSLRGEVVHLATLRGIGPVHSAGLGKDLLELSAEANAEHAVHDVRALGWLAVAAKSADALASGALAASARAAVDVRVFGVDGVLPLAELPADEAAPLTARAAMEFERRARGSVVLRGVVKGSTDVLPGSWLELEGIAEPLAGRHVVVSTEHTLDARSGWLTRFSSEPPSDVAAPQREAVSLGVVTRVDDPEGLARVRVQFPGAGSIESGWLPVACPGAGPNKGFVHLPDLDDRVLVVIPHGDFAAGVVIAGLYGEAPPPESGVVETQTRKFTWQSPAGQRIQLDDAESTTSIAATDRVRLSIGNGSFLDVSPARVELKAHSDLVLSAPGRRIVLEAARIDFREMAE
jgi:phage baseplate assembly protein V